MSAEVYEKNTTDETAMIGRMCEAAMAAAEGKVEVVVLTILYKNEQKDNLGRPFFLSIGAIMAPALDPQTRAHAMHTLLLDFPSSAKRWAKAMQRQLFGKAG